jgi:hypothetical protein
VLGADDARSAGGTAKVPLRGVAVHRAREDIAHVHQRVLTLEKIDGQDPLASRAVAVAKANDHKGRGLNEPSEAAGAGHG